MRFRRRYFICAVLPARVLAGVLLLGVVRAVEAPLLPPPAEAAQAAFVQAAVSHLVAFATQVILPAGAPPAGEPFRVGILGFDPLGAALDRSLAEAETAGRKLVVVRANHPAALARCQIVFAYNPSLVAMDDLLAVTSQKPILTVVYSADRSARGAIIELYQVRTRVRFTINRTELYRAGLKLPTNLTLARKAPP